MTLACSCCCYRCCCNGSPDQRGRKIQIQPTAHVWNASGEDSERGHRQPLWLNRLGMTLSTLTLWTGWWEWMRIRCRGRVTRCPVFKGTVPFLGDFFLYRCLLPLTPIFHSCYLLTPCRGGKWIIRWTRLFCNDHCLGLWCGHISNTILTSLSPCHRKTQNQTFPNVNVAAGLAENSNRLSLWAKSSKPDKDHMQTAPGLGRSPVLLINDLIQWGGAGH